MITNPSILLARKDVFIKPCPVPAELGVYAWYFKDVPPLVPLTDCVQFKNLWLLYVGISPKRPPRGGNPSRESLRTRIRYHYRGNAEGSTLRLTLGCLLSDKLGIELRRVGSGKRLTFTHYGEEKLSQWMEENAFVTWEVRAEPWLYEKKLIEKISFPLNLQGNEDHPFRINLSQIRADARTRARNRPIILK